MKDIVEYIVKQFVSNPDGVEVNESTQEGFINISLKVDPADMGLVIGKSGQTIKAIRRLLTVKAIADNVRVNLELIDTNPLPREGAAPADAPVMSEENISEAPMPETAKEAAEVLEEAPAEESKEEAAPKE